MGGYSPEESSEQAAVPIISGDKAILPDNDVPDPEEDELDDLDGMTRPLSLRIYQFLIKILDILDEFSATKLKEHHVALSSSEPRQRQAPLHEIFDTDTSDFSKQLRAQVAALMGDVDESPESKREIGTIVRGLGAASDSEKVQNHNNVNPNGRSSSPKTEALFQESIRKTMERMQTSGEQATAAANSEDSGDVLAHMLKEMQGDGTEGAADEEGFNQMLMGMMEQLTNKEVLYEPMKELNDKFPAWMLKNKGNTASEDFRRYEEQQRLVGNIVERFERKGYSDSHTTDREFIVEQMQQVSTMTQTKRSIH